MKPPKKKSLIGAGWVAFRARQVAIKEMIDAGYTMAAIYAKYQKEVAVSYGQFVNYVHKLKASLEPTERKPVAADSEKVDVAESEPPQPPQEQTIGNESGRKKGREYKDDSIAKAKDADLF